MCDQVAWLDAGVLRAVGPAGDLVDQYLGEVNQERALEEHATGSRWGTGEALLEAMEILDAGGRPTTDLHTGDVVTFRLHYAAGEPIVNPAFGLAIHTVEGVQVTGPTTRAHDVEIERVEGRGIVDLVVDPLLLLPGTYDLSGSITDAAGLHVFDMRHRGLRFDVEPGRPHETDGGIVSLNGRWSVQPAPTHPVTP
jgi:ABC-2 type transport system ATP-binding protein